MKEGMKRNKISCVFVGINGFEQTDKDTER